MPKNKPFMNEVCEIYRSSHEDTALYFYYVGIKQILPNVSDQKIVSMWLDKMGFSEDEYPLKTAQQVLFTMKKRYLKNS